MKKSVLFGLLGCVLIGGVVLPEDVAESELNYFDRTKAYEPKLYNEIMTTYLRQAIEGGDLDMIKVLIKRGVDVNAILPVRQLYPIMLAIDCYLDKNQPGRRDIILQLLLAGADMNLKLKRSFDHFRAGDNAHRLIDLYAFLSHIKELSDHINAAVAGQVSQAASGSLRFDTRDIVEMAKAFILSHESCWIEIGKEIFSIILMSDGLGKKNDKALKDKSDLEMGAICTIMYHCLCKDSLCFDDLFSWHHFFDIQSFLFKKTALSNDIVSFLKTFIARRLSQVLL